MGRVLQRNDFAKPGTFSYVGGGGTLQHLPASPVQGEVARSAGGVVRRAQRTAEESLVSLLPTQKTPSRPAGRFRNTFRLQYEPTLRPVLPCKRPGR